MNRYARIAVLLVLLQASSSALAIGLIKGPYLQNVSTDGITVMWETDQPATGSVAYGPKGQLTRRAQAAKAGKIQEVRLSGLQPETAYEYRLEVGREKVGPFAFRTAVKRPTPFRFAVYGDNRSYPKTHAAIVEAMAKHKPAFVINTGDLVSDGNKYDQWGPQFFAPLAKLSRHVPIYPALGNHEGDGTLYKKFFSLPEPEWYYSYEYGNAKFVVLDSCFRKPDWFARDSKQGQWAVRELDTRDATWKFAAFHHPPYSSHPRRGCSLAHQATLCPTLEAHGVDVAFNGHNHNYECIFPMRSRKRDDAKGVHYVITGGGGASTYAARVDYFTAAYERAYNYCIVEIDGSLMTLTAYAIDGHVIDRFGLCKDLGRLTRMAEKAKSLSDSDRAKAVEQLGVVFSIKTPGLLAEFAADKDVAVRRAVAGGLGRLAMADGRPIALKLLADSDPRVRRGAALAVARTSSVDDIETVAKMLTDTDAGVRRNAAMFFIHVRGLELIEPVLSAMDDPDANVRRLVMRGIDGLRDKSIRPILAKAVADDDAEVATAGTSLTLKGRHAAYLIEPLIKAARHKDNGVRHNAVKALVASRKKDKVIPILIDALTDKEPRVQGHAVGALERWTKQDFGYDQAKWKKWWAGQKR